MNDSVRELPIVSNARVLWRGKAAYLYEVPLGQEFVLNGRVYQSAVVPTVYRLVGMTQRFRYRDRWYYKDARIDVMVLKDNMPFERPTADRTAHTFSGSERVALLIIEDRGEA